MTERETIESIRPPSVSRGDVAMLARVEHSLFGSSSEASPGIGPYRILERLGTGGMGVVYAAYDPKLERKVALKVLRRGLVMERGRDRLIAEARTLAKLSHPNVVSVYDVNFHEDEVYVVMELVEGRNLAAWQREVHDLDTILATYLSAGTGLGAAHRLGIVHRDFKPANVLVGDEGLVKVADFGLASSALETESGVGSDELSRSVVGTRGYIAPELWAGEPADPRSDQFAFCVSLWEALAGQPPFARDQVPTAPPKGSGVGPRWLVQALRRGLDPDPSARWPSMDALLERLAKTRVRRRRWTFGGLGVAMVAGLVFAAYGAGGVPTCEFDGEVWTTSELSTLETRLGGLREPGAAASAAALIDELGAYEARWAEVGRQACELGQGWASERTHACLRRTRARALVLGDAIVAAPSFVEARSLVDELEDPRTCEAREGSQTMLALATSFTSLADERALAALRVAIVRGQLDWAQARAKILAERPGNTGTQALLLLGRVLREAGERDEARARLLDAHHRATLGRSPQTGLDVELALAELSALEYDNVLDAHSWLDQARTSWLALDQPLIAGMDLRYVEALVHGAAGEHARARDLLRTSLAELELLGVEPRRLDRTRLALANAIASLGDHDEAIPIYRALLADHERRFGPEHPLVGILAFNIGGSLVDGERWAEARPVLERALAIETQAYGPSSLRVAQVQIRLAETEVEIGSIERAIELIDAASATYARSLDADEEGAEAPLFALAWINLQAERWAEADASYRVALANYEPDDEDRAAVYQTLAWVSCRQDPPCVGARAELEHVRALADSGSLVRLRAASVEAELALLDGDAGLARDHALSTLEQLAHLESGIDPELEAELEALAGLALIELGEGSAAREHLLNATGRSEHLVDDLEARAVRALADLDDPQEKDP